MLIEEALLQPQQYSIVSQKHENLDKMENVSLH